MNTDKYKANVIAFVLVLGVYGCAAPQAEYVDPNGARVLATNDINTQDFSIAAEDAINSLLESGKVKVLKGDDPAILAMSRIINNTTQHIDTDMLVKKIRVALNKSGKAYTTTTFGPGGKGEDGLGQGLAEKDDFLSGKDRPDPDFTLSGKIIQNNAVVGNKRQVSFTFQLSLTDTRKGSRTRGLAIWEEEKVIIKQTKRRGIGL